MSSRRRQIDNDPFSRPAVVTSAVSDDFLNTLSPADMDTVGYGGASLPVVREVDGTVYLGNFTLTPTGLVIERDVTESEWKAFYANIQRTRRALQWIVGDWMIYGIEHEWTTSYEAMAALTGLKEKTVREYTYVCRNVPMSIRMDKLKFAHHQAVAALGEAHQREWLAYAADNKLSVATLKAEIARWSTGAAIEGTDPPTPPDETPHLYADPIHRKRFRRVWKLIQKDDIHAITNADLKSLEDWIAMIRNMKK